MTQQEAHPFGERLEAYLLETCTSQGFLQGTRLSSPDIDEAWLRLAPSFYGDAVRNFNAYPEFTLACAGYLGMAVAHLWDKDWPAYRDVPYSFFLGERGFDDMDDRITGTILRESRRSVAAMQSASASAYHFLMKEAPEPGTAEAYRFFLAAVETMFKTGAAIELCRLGYKYEKVSLK
jgi:hypothetical protein